MKAFVLSSGDRAPELEEVPEPVAAKAGTAVVDVLAAGLNPADVGRATGRTASGPYPRVLGMEAVVEIDGKAAYVEQVVGPHGSYAGRTVVEVADAIALPDGISPTEAVPLGIAGLAGWVPIETTGALKPGETVLVLGATGATGQAAVQASRILGAGRVVAAGRDRQKLQRLLSRGADEIVVLGSDDDAAAMREATNGGADLIFDALYAAPLAAALKSAKPGARSVTIGNMAGARLDLPLMALYGRSLLSYANPMAPRDVKAAAFTAMARHVVSGDFVIEHEVVALSDIAAAWARQVAKAGVKFVITP